MQLREEGGNLLIEGACEMDLQSIFECGQCFRFKKTDDKAYLGVAYGRPLKIDQRGDVITLYGVNMHDWEQTWKSYFDFECDYGAIKQRLATDEVMIKAMEVSGGIRILRQELWECLISFIISQNNNIPRIKKIIEGLCENYGKKIEFEGETLYAFPTPQELGRATKEELALLGLGYRDEYVALITNKVKTGKFSLEELSKMSTSQARSMLISQRGIGGKVADCILLFGMHRTEVCPHDVWVKRIFKEKYGIENVTEKKGYALCESKWGEYSGIAQQYLFYAQREGK